MMREPDQKIMRAPKMGNDVKVVYLGHIPPKEDANKEAPPSYAIMFCEPCTFNFNESDKSKNKRIANGFTTLPPATTFSVEKGDDRITSTFGFKPEEYIAGNVYLARGVTFCYYKDKKFGEVHVSLNVYKLEMCENSVFDFFSFPLDAALFEKTKILPTDIKSDAYFTKEGDDASYHRFMMYMLPQAKHDYAIPDDMPQGTSCAMYPFFGDGKNTIVAKNLVYSNEKTKVEAIAILNGEGGNQQLRVKQKDNEGNTVRYLFLNRLFRSFEMFQFSNMQMWKMQIPNFIPNFQGWLFGSCNRKDTVDINAYDGYDGTAVVNLTFSGDLRKMVMETGFQVTAADAEKILSNEKYLSPRTPKLNLMSISAWGAVNLTTFGNSMEDKNIIRAWLTNPVMKFYLTTNHAMSDGNMAQIRELPYEERTALLLMEKKNKSFDIGIVLSLSLWAMVDETKFVDNPQDMPTLWMTKTGATKGAVKAPVKASPTTPTPPSKRQHTLHDVDDKDDDTPKKGKEEEDDDDDDDDDGVDVQMADASE
jgi:hypothetical protein